MLARVNPNNDLVGLIDNEGVGCVDLALSLDSLQGLAERMANDPKARESMAMRGRALARKLFSPDTAVRQIVSSLSRNV